MTEGTGWIKSSLGDVRDEEKRSGAPVRTRTGNQLIQRGSIRRRYAWNNNGLCVDFSARERLGYGFAPRRRMIDTLRYAGKMPISNDKGFHERQRATNRNRATYL